MALSINRTLSDDNSRAAFEIVNVDGTAIDQTIITASTLTGANTTGQTNHMLRVVKVEALVCDNSGGGGSVTLEWDDGTTETAFLTLPVGHTVTTLSCTPPAASTTTSGFYVTSTDINVLSSDTNISFTLRIYVEKVRGFEESLVNKLLND